MSKKSITLTKEQQKIIKDTGDVIVVANPGTGKTTTLSFKIIELLKNNVSPEDILCITYTEKAKREMYQAIRENSNGAINNSIISKINIHTFHSFALNYLKESGLFTGSVIGNNILRYSIYKSFEKHDVFNYSKNYLISDMVPKVENAIRYIKNFGITPDKIIPKNVFKHVQTLHDETNSVYTMEQMLVFLEKFVKIYNDYEKSKKSQIDYTDMLLEFVKSYSGKKFPFVAVDEMQDMNEVESKMVNMVREKIFIVGDSKQAIFGFQGGSVKNFEEFQKTCNSHYLTENKRSTQQILDYAKNYFLKQTIRPKNFERELKNLNSKTSGKPPKIIVTEAPYLKALEIIKKNPTKKIGVITRSNYQIIEFSKFLDQEEIKYVTTSSQSTTEQARNEISVFLQGVLSTKIKEKIPALFTFFSNNSLLEAFKISQQFDNKVKNIQLPSNLTIHNKLQKSHLGDLFEKIIYPICVGMGPEWLPTAISVKNQIDEYLELENPSIEGLFDFIKIVEESYNESNLESKVTLSTVHKSKGRTFDIVIYIPTKPTTHSFVDTIVKSILLSNGIDIREEIEEELLRIDFVAFTRAAKELFILSNENLEEKYTIENFCKKETDDTPKDSQKVNVSADYKMKEAYSLFVNGNHAESKKILEKSNNWLTDYIHNYFKTLDHLSFSSITTEPYEFMKKNIMKIPFNDGSSSGGFGTNFGNQFHIFIENILKGRKISDKLHPNMKKSINNALKALKQLKKEYPGLEIVSVEKKFEDFDLCQIMNYKKPMNLSGKIDLVCKHDDGYLIVDWKTNKKIETEHKQQLAAYKKVYAKLNNIDEEKISTCNVYVSKRDSIQTGTLGMEIVKGSTRDVFKTFEKHTLEVLSWRDNPDLYISEILKVKDDDMLLDAIKSNLV